MKNRFTHLLFLLIIISFACNKDNDCDGSVSLDAVVPNSNPPGTEVKIVGDGFSTKPTVRFAGQVAKSDFSVEKGLTAIVPNNVIGLVDLTVEDGECLVRTDFEVLGALPVNWVASPTVIVIPTFPPNFPQSINNVWLNYYDKDHTLNIQPDGFPCDMQTIDPGNFENHKTNPFLNNNPITGSYNCNTGKTVLIIDRTKNGGEIDTLDGIIILPETVGESNSITSLFMLLTSRTTGRQFVIRQP